MKKVYYVNGWPNNGFGWKMFWRFVKRYDTGDIIFVKKTMPLETFLIERKAVIDSVSNCLNRSEAALDIFERQKYELYIGQAFLDGKFAVPQIRL